MNIGVIGDTLTSIEGSAFHCVYFVMHFLYILFYLSKDQESPAIGIDIYNIADDCLLCLC